jgi:hypothetical protein
MRRITALAALLFLGLVAIPAGDNDGVKPLFNGKDLTGWHNVNCAPGTFYVKDNMIITTGKPTGYLRTDRQYENFILEFEWFHAPSPKGSVGNSGMFVWGDPLPAVGTGYTRSIEVQVLVNLEWTDKKSGKSTATSQGDLFSIWGAKCKPDRPHPLGWERCIPSENNCKGEFEWNHYKVFANNGVIKLTVNGKEVSGVSECNPRKGYLALESEGSECRFKNLKIKELPSTNPKANEVCDVDKGLTCMFTGLDLSGWKADDEQAKHWKMSDGVLRYDGKGMPLVSEKSYGDLELVCDFTAVSNIRLGRLPGTIELEPTKMGFNRAIIRLKGQMYTLEINGKTTVEDKAFMNKATSGPISLASTGAGQFRNVFARELKAGE